MTKTTMAEMNELHRLLITDLTRRMNPKTAKRPPGVETLAVVASLMRQEGMTAANIPSLKPKLRKLERLYIQAVLKGMEDNPTPTLVAEAGKVVRAVKNGPLPHVPDMPTEPMSPEALGALNLPFSD